MALRDKLVRRSAPYLEPGEQVQAVFLAQSGPNPYFILLAFLIILIGARYAVVVVTDRAIVVLRAGVFTPTFPKRVVVRLPRASWLGEPSGLWGKVQLDKRYWVHKRFHKDVRAANQLLTAMYPGGPPPMQPPPPPYGPPQQYGPPQGPPPQYGAPPQQPYGAPPPDYR